MISPQQFTPQFSSSSSSFDSIKPMLMTMMMVKNDGKDMNILNIVWSMIAMALVEWVISNSKQACDNLHQYISSKLTAKLNTIEIPTSLSTTTVKEAPKPILATITVQLELSDTSKNPLSFAILDIVTNCVHTKSIKFQNNNYIIDYYEPIQLEHHVYARLLSATEAATDQSGSSGKTTEPTQNILLYSYTLNMCQLRDKLEGYITEYLIKIKNKLGNKLYYFNELKMDNSDSRHRNPLLHFTMKHFQTNKRFSNLYGEEAALIRKRVEFFRDNEEWYDTRGIPYTLGILLEGQAGAGKTSTIKCLANELKRHIVNVQLTKTTTKQQFEALMYDDILTVTQNGKTEQYSIPISKRLFVFEDIDCECDIVYERKAATTDEMQEAKETIAKLEKELSNFKNLQVGKQPQAGSSADDVITLAFILNVIDGIMERRNSVMVMTSNFAEKLDHALIRPGRIDISIKYGNCRHNMFMSMISGYYGCVLNDDQTKRIMALPENVLSPAELSKYVFENFDDINGAIQTLEKVCKVDETTNEKACLNTDEKACLNTDEKACLNTDETILENVCNVDASINENKGTVLEHEQNGRCGLLTLPTDIRGSVQLQLQNSIDNNKHSIICHDCKHVCHNAYNGMMCSNSPCTSVLRQMPLDINNLADMAYNPSDDSNSFSLISA